MNIELQFFISVQFLALMITIVRLSFTLFGAGVRGGILTPIATISDEICKPADEEVDKALAVAKNKISSEVSTTLVKGYHEDLELRMLGIRLPWTISMNVSNGELTSYETIKLASNATGCTSTLMLTTLDAAFTYEKDLRLTYQSMTVKFLGRTFAGSLSYSLRPNISLIITKSSEDCRMSTFHLDSPGIIAYDVITDSGWTSRLVGMGLRLALYQHTSTPLLEKIKEHLLDNINLFFVPAWCHIIVITH